jgi:anti-sigma regulatory factor (Ser/Thr protein kinase)
MGNEGVLNKTFDVAAGDFASAGSASTSIKEMLKRLGVNPAVIRRVAVAAYEAEMNLIIHSRGGQLTLIVDPPQIRLHCQDAGPGIPDVARALEEGFSTAPESVQELGFGAGMGLPNMKRCANEFDISSAIGVGTQIWMAFQLA